MLRENHAILTFFVAHSGKSELVIFNLVILQLARLPPTPAAAVAPQEAEARAVLPAPPLRAGRRKGTHCIPALHVPYGITEQMTCVTLVLPYPGVTARLVRSLSSCSKGFQHQTNTLSNVCFDTGNVFMFVKPRAA